MNKLEKYKATKVTSCLLFSQFSCLVSVPSERVDMGEVTATTLNSMAF